MLTRREEGHRSHEHILRLLEPVETVSYGSQGTQTLPGTPLLEIVGLGACGHLATCPAKGCMPPLPEHRLPWAASSGVTKRPTEEVLCLETESGVECNMTDLYSCSLEKEIWSSMGKDL